MSENNFISKLESRWQKSQQNTAVCIGLDSEFAKIPLGLKNSAATDGSISSIITRFNQEIIDATHDLVCAFKPNIAFYEAEGTQGMLALKNTSEYIRSNHPEIPIILDAKRADIGSTNSGYAKAAFDELKVDAITVHPYLGREALEPFLARGDKGILVLARTSNPGGGEFQDLLVGDKKEPLYQLVARQVSEKWNDNGNCGLVAGATYPEELKRLREIVGDLPFLIPGIGAQGGDLKATVRSGKDSRGQGMIINSSRSVIFASADVKDFAQKAREETLKLRDEIRRFLVEV